MAANARYLQDVTIPDDTPMPAGASFTKTWLVQNTGDVMWGAGFRLVHTAGDPMTTATSVMLPPASPGQQVQISLGLTAPHQPGTRFSDWRFVDDKGAFFGDIIYLRIKVEPAAAPVSAGSAGNASYFLADVTIPNDSEIAGGASFTKTWSVRNSGSKAWGPGYSLRFVEGTPMTSVVSVPLPPAAPGADVNISLTLSAPTAPGKYYSDWRTFDENGVPFGATLWTRIVVPKPVEQERKYIARHLSQRDPRWERTPLANMPNAPSLGRWGCLLTSFAMTANALGKRTDPAKLNEDMLQKGGFVNGYFTRWEALSIVYPDLIFEGKFDRDPANVGRIDAKLNQGIPVTMLVDLTPNTVYSDNDQHWVVVVARSGDDYLIMDPWTLTDDPISLKARYGRPGGSLADAIQSAIFYRK